MTGGAKSTGGDPIAGSAGAAGSSIGCANDQLNVPCQMPMTISSPVPCQNAPCNQHICVVSGSDPLNVGECRSKCVNGNLIDGMCFQTS